MARIVCVVKITLVGLLVVLFGRAASGGTINFRLAIDDVVANEHVRTPGSTIKVAIEANVPDVPDVPLGGGGHGGVIQYAINLLDSTGTGAGSVLVPVDADTNGFWDSQSYAPLNLNVAGLVDASGYDVYDQTGAIVPPTSDTGLGAGPGVWSVIGSGDFLYNGGTTVLTIEPYGLSSQLVWGPSGSETPTAAGSYSTTITPEPGTCALLGLGILLLLRRRRPTGFA